jgi:RimJ/RimL family protein N-acetyltransferase
MSDMAATVATMPDIALEPWSDRGYAVLVTLNSPDLTEHLGGPESPEQLLRRHQRYLDSAAEATADTANGRMFLIVAAGEAVGLIGYWPRQWDGRQVYETGYGVVPDHQGRGLAAKALTQCAAHAARHGSLEWLHAFPSIHHAASNAVCRKAGFELLGERDFEYPPGTPIRVNDWRLSLANPSRERRP